MKKNPWNYIKPQDYNAHMSCPNVAQSQMLNKITKEQFELLPEKTRQSSSVAVLGIAAGNGLEHVDSCGIASVIGIDISYAFLDECHARFSDLESNAKLKLFHLDLKEETDKSVEILSNCDLIIANLIIEHIHLSNFIKIVAGLPKNNQIVSCTIQVNSDGTQVSKSGYEKAFDNILCQHEEVNEDSILSAMTDNGFALFGRDMYDLPNGKQFVRMDFAA